MDIQKKPTLAEKQEFWAEQLPNFEATYWLQSHFEFVVFDMDQGNYVIKEGLGADFEDDATEIWHRVNTGWAMWKKAIDFSRKNAQAVPNTQALHDRLLVKSIKEHVESHIAEISVNDLFDKGWLAAMKCIQNNIDMLEAQEPAND